MGAEVFGFAVWALRPSSRQAMQAMQATAYCRNSRTYTVARAMCSAAKGMASLTKRPNDIAKPFLCMMVTATSVEAEPIGVRLPPRLVPKTTDH